MCRYVGICVCLFPYPCYKVVGEHRSPTLVYDGGRDFGRPGSVLRKKGADRPCRPMLGLC